MPRGAGVKVRWTPELLEYIKEVAPGKHAHEVAELVNDKFGLNMTPNALKGAVIRYRLGVHFKPYHFQKGIPSCRRGTKLSEEHKDALRKSGSPYFTKREDRYVSNAHPVGAERVIRGGYTEVKVTGERYRPLVSSDYDYHNCAWIPKHYKVWIDNGGISFDRKKHMIVFIDGNKNNFDMSNLKLVSKDVFTKMDRLNRWCTCENELASDINKANLFITEMELRVNQKYKRVKLTCIPGKEDCEIDTDGNIYYFRGGKWKKYRTYDNGNGYKQIRMNTCKKKKGHFYVHRLVAKQFVPNKFDYNNVMHIDGDKSNNRAINLRWTTKEESMQRSTHVFKQKTFNNNAKEIYYVKAGTTEIFKINSIQNCAKALHIVEATIRKALERPIKYTSGYYFSETGEFPYDTTVFPKGHKRKFYALDIKTGRQYILNSQAEMARVFNVLPSEVCECLKGGNRVSLKGFKVSYNKFKNYVHKLPEVVDK